MPTAVMGDFAGKEEAQHAVEALRSLGVPASDISVILEQPRHSRTTPQEESEVGAGLLTGAATGAIVGGLAGWVLSLGLFDMYGVGRVATEFGTGSTVLGAMLGAVLLGLLGAIGGLSFRGREYLTQDPDVLLTVRSGTLGAEKIGELMREHNALNVQPTDDVPARETEEPTLAPGSLPANAPDAAPAPQPQNRTTSTSTVRPGQAVYSLDREKLGEVSEITGDYFTVKGGLFHHDLYVPLGDVHEMREDALYVNAVRDEVEMKGWREQPLHSEHHGEGPTRP